MNNELSNYDFFRNPVITYMNYLVGEFYKNEKKIKEFFNDRDSKLNYLLYDNMSVIMSDMNKRLSEIKSDINNIELSFEEPNDIMINQLENIARDMDEIFNYFEGYVVEKINKKRELK